jgi:hypothetical protein
MAAAQAPAAARAVAGRGQGRLTAIWMMMCRFETS